MNHVHHNFFGMERWICEHDMFYTSITPKHGKFYVSAFWQKKHRPENVKIIVDPKGANTNKSYFPPLFGTKIVDTLEIAKLEAERMLFELSDPQKDRYQ